MEAEEFRQGINSLDLLANDEYHQGIGEVAEDPDPVQAAVRIGRLVGVTLKEPFASPRTMDAPSQRTAAYREWDLVTSEREFEQPHRVGTWQYKTLDGVKKELTLEDPQMGEWSNYDFAFWAYNENGFFGCFARAVRRYVCGDPVIRTKVENAIEASRKSGVNVSEMSPEVIVASGGAALGTYLVAAVPFLGFVGVPVIAALVLILYRLGVEGFCDWSNRLRTDEDEKH